MAKTLDVKSEHLEQLKALLRQYAPNAEVWAYGSRVKGVGHDASDLDLVVRSPESPGERQKNLSEIKEVISESDIPILIDVLDWASIPESFHEEISKDHVVIQKPVTDASGPVDSANEPTVVARASCS